MESHDTPTTTPGPAPSAGYEFNPSEDAVIGDTARWVGIWAWFAIALGVIMAIAGAVDLPAGVGEIIIGVVYIVIGVYFRGAGSSLKNVVTTEGDDIAHLLTALGNVRSAFRVMVIVTALGVLGGIIVGFMAAG